MSKDISRRRLLSNPNNSIPIMINKEMVLGATGYQSIATRKDKKRTTAEENPSDPRQNILKQVKSLID